VDAGQRAVAKRWCVERREDGMTRRGKYVKDEKRDWRDSGSTGVGRREKKGWIKLVRDEERWRRRGRVLK